jgi:hypothetical protein
MLREAAEGGFFKLARFNKKPLIDFMIDGRWGFANNISYKQTLWKSGDIAMKKSIGSLIIILLSSVSVYAGTDPNRWDGFRGLKWGTNIKDLNDPNMMLTEGYNKEKYYKRLNDKLSIGDANLKEITYVFYENRFYGVMIETKGYMNFSALKDAIFAYYGDGKPNGNYSNSWLWSPELGNSRNVMIVFGYDESQGITVVVMTYKPILNEMQTDKARKAKEASKDF